MRSDAQTKQYSDWDAYGQFQQAPQQTTMPNAAGRRARLHADDGFMRVAPLDEPTVSHSARIERQPGVTTPVRHTPQKPHVTAYPTRFGTPADTRRVMPPGTKTTGQISKATPQTTGEREWRYLQTRRDNQGYRTEELADTPDGFVASVPVMTRHDTLGGASECPSRRENRFREQENAYATQSALGSEADAMRRVQGDIALRKTFIFISVLTAVLIIVFTMVLVVRDVQVIGVPDEAAAEILQAAGIQVGQRITEIKEASVARNVNSSSRWTFKSMKITYPSSVLIEVQERRPVAVIRRMGIQYFIDGKGMVLGMSENIDVKYADMPEISGLKISHCAVGSFLNVLDERQWTILRSMLVEIKVSPELRMITNINLTDPSNILLSTLDGYSVRLGNKENLHAKLKALIYVVKTLSQDASYGMGTLDIRSPEKPTFSPEVNPAIPESAQQQTSDDSTGLDAAQSVANVNLPWDTPAP